MLYHFGAADIRNETEADDPATGIPYSLLALKRMYAEWDAAVGDGWPTIYLGNHDQPRMVSRFGSDAPEWRDLSAKMLTMFLLTMREPLLAGRRRTGHDQHPIHPHRRVRRH